MDVSDRAGRLLGIIASITSAVDISDRAARLLGKVGIQVGGADVAAANPVPVSPGTGATFDVADRAARLVGQVSAAVGATFDVSDRAGRLLGVVSQGVGAAATPWYVRPAHIATYQAVYRLAARPYALSIAPAAAGRTQMATLYHPATAAKNVRVRTVQVAIESTSAAAILEADLMRLTAVTAPATGNPAIVPSPLDTSDVAAEATALALPTTAGSEGALIASLEWNLGITGAASTAAPPPPLTYTTLYQYGTDGEQKPLLLRAGVAEGVAVTFDVSAAATIKAYVIVTFTEE